MKTSRHHLAEVIGKRTLSVRDPHRLAQEIAAFLLTEKQTTHFGSLMRDIMQYRLDHGLVEATAVSAHDLSQPILSEIKSILKAHHPSAKSITVNQAQNPELIGGVRIDLPNEQLDLSLQSRLATFKRVTSERTS